MVSQQRDRRDSCASTRRDDLAIGSSDWLGREPPTLFGMRSRFDPLLLGNSDLTFSIQLLSSAYGLKRIQMNFRTAEVLHACEMFVAVAFTRNAIFRGLNTKRTYSRLRISL